MLRRTCVDPLILPGSLTVPARPETLPHSPHWLNSPWNGLPEGTIEMLHCDINDPQKAIQQESLFK